MADKKISELDVINGADTAADDFFVVVDTSGSATKKISRAELNNAIEQDVLAQVDITSANIDGGTIDNTPIGSTTASTGNFTTVDTTGNVTVGGNLTVQGTTVTVDTATVQTVDLGDNDKIRLGNSQDLQLFHDGSNSIVYEGGAGTLKLATAGGSVDIVKGSDSSETMAKFLINGAAELYYDNSKKISTSSTGADINGVLTADGLTVDGNAVINDSGSGANQLKISHNDAGTIASPEFTDILFTGFSGRDKSRIRSLDINSSAQGGELVFQTTASNTTDQSSLTDRLKISRVGDISFYDSTGVTQGLFWDASTQRLGLGTTSPGETLSAVGNIEASNTSSNVRLMATASGVANAYFGFNNSGSTQNGIPNNSAYVTVPQSYPISFGTANQNRMTITSGGSVGIGIASPAYKLDVNSGNTNAVARFESTDASAEIDIVDSGGYSRISNVNGSLLFEADRGNATASSTIEFDIDGSEAMRIDSGGKVGIGTDSPVASSLLTLKETNAGGDGAELRLINSSTTVDSATQIVFTNTTTDTADSAVIKAVRTASGQDFRFSSDGSERMRLDSSGNLLVGKTSADLATAGVELSQIGQVKATRAGTAAYFNRTSTDGDIVEFRKDNATVGSIGAKFSGRSYIASGSSSNTGVRFDTNFIAPADATGANRDNAINLGSSGDRFKDLYLSGGVYLGGTGSANYLDDYEEGTWTPVVTGRTTAGTGTYSRQNGYYTKIGNLVRVHIDLVLTAHTGTGGFVISLPFTSEATLGNNPVFAVNAVNLTFSNQLFAAVDRSASTCGLLAMSSGASNTIINIDGSADLNITGTYIVA